MYQYNKSPYDCLRYFIKAEIFSVHVFYTNLNSNPFQILGAIGHSKIKNCKKNFTCYNIKVSFYIHY